MVPIKWRTANDGLNQSVSESTAVDFSDDPGLTQQQFAEDADINTLIRRFGLSGDMPAPRAVPQYGDFSDVVDYQTALDRLLEADSAFMSLPADVRKRFDNSPAQLWQFLHGGEANLEEARKLGLVEMPKAPPAPVKVEVTNPVPPPAAGPPGGN